MSMRTGTLLATLLLAGGLSACGGGSSEFKTKALAECQKSPEAAKHDCACAVDIMDKELDEKTKKIFIVMSDPELQKDPVKAEAALKEAGVKPEEMMSVISSMAPVMEKVEKECSKA